MAHPPVDCPVAPPARRRLPEAGTVLLVLAAVLAAPAAGSGVIPTDPTLLLVEEIEEPVDIRVFGNQISADGDLLAATLFEANGDDFNVYTFRRESGSWASPQPLFVSAPNPNAGSRIDVMDGAVAVGNWPRGTAFLFTLPALPGRISEAEVEALLPLEGVTEVGGFATDVAVETPRRLPPGLPPLLVVGAPSSRIAGTAGSHTGAVFVFSPSPMGAGLRLARVYPGQFAGRRIGELVDISGTRIVAAGNRWLEIFDYDHFETGATPTRFSVPSDITDVAIRGRVVAASYGRRVAVYRLSGGDWSRILTLNPPGDSDVVSVDVQGSRVLAGGGGSAHLYDLSGALLGTVSQASQFDSFGDSVALNGTTAFVSSRLTDRIFAYDAAPGCDAISATPASLTFGPVADTMEVQLAVSPKDCAWNIDTSRARPIWATPSNGIGDAMLTVHVRDRPLTVPVSLDLRLSTGDAIEVTQQAASTTSCGILTLDNYERISPGPGESFSVGVGASSSDCTWTTVSGASWLQVSPESGTGSYTATVTVEPNPTDFRERVGSVFIGGRELTVTQQAPARRVACGEFIGADTTLGEDLDCSGLTRNNPALILGDATLNLNGFDLIGPAAVGRNVAGSVGVLVVDSQGTIDGRRLAGSGEGDGAILGFDYGVAAYDSKLFTCASLGDLTEGACGGSDEDLTSGRPTATAAESHTTVSVTAVEMENRVGLFAFGAVVTVQDSFFHDQKDEPLWIVGGRAELDGLEIRDNGLPLQLESVEPTTVSGSRFIGNTNAALHLVDLDNATITGNLFDGNNYLTENEPTLNGQLAISIRNVWPTEILVSGNAFSDDTREGAGALDPDGVDENERPGHGGVGLAQTPEGDGMAPPDHLIRLQGNDFASGDAGLYLWGGGAFIELLDNQFRAPLAFNVGVRAGTDANQRLAHTGNCVRNGVPFLVDPNGTVVVVVDDPDVAGSNCD